jgi:NAD(P)-dependent dehydrogenase (short-subunit alcohol dehydrogenase family)
MAMVAGSGGARSALVTGAASGIGRALAEELGRRGVAVTVADRQAEAGAEVVEAIRGRGGAARFAELDVRDAARFRSAIDEHVGAYGRIDLLFNNAGIGVGAEMRDYDAADWDDVVDVNLRGVAYGVLAAYPRMIEQRSGHIVNTASMAGLVPSPFQGSYTATKHAVVGLSRALRAEAQAYGVRVSVLCPGAIRTPIFTGGRYGRVKLGVDPERAAAMFERMRPMDAGLFARRALDQVERNRAVIIVPGWWRALWWVERASPALGDWLGRVFVTRSRRELEAMRRAERAPDGEG